MQHVVAGQGREMLQQSFHTSSFFGFWSSELLWPLSPGFLRFWPDVAAAAAVACLPKLLTNQMALECWRDSRGNCLKRKCAPFAHVAAGVLLLLLPISCHLLTTHNGYCLVFCIKVVFHLTLRIIFFSVLSAPLVQLFLVLVFRLEGSCRLSGHPSLLPHFPFGPAELASGMA